VDRGQFGTNVHLATDGRGMPLGAVITGVNANDGQQAGELPQAMVIQPPSPDEQPPTPDVRDWPSARGDGAYGNEPTVPSSRRTWIGISSGGLRSSGISP
jgi:hypothetical protein